MHRYCFILLTGCLLTACNDKNTPSENGTRGNTSGSESSQSGNATQSQSQPTWMASEAPADAMDIFAVKQSAQEGDLVVIRGILGGRKEPISKDNAMFVLIDSSVDNPCTIGDDHCPTPWDYCCTPKEAITEGMATVLLVDENGAPLALNLEQHGLRPLDRITVTGTVGPRPAPQVLTIQATSLYKAPN